MRMSELLLFVNYNIGLELLNEGPVIWCFWILCYQHDDWKMTFVVHSTAQYCVIIHYSMQNS